MADPETEEVEKREYYHVWLPMDAKTPKRMRIGNNLVFDKTQDDEDHPESAKKKARFTASEVESLRDRGFRFKKAAAKASEEKEAQPGKPQKKEAVQ